MSKKEMSFKRLKSIIENSALFDKIYYLRTYSDARRANDTPLDHFVKIGLKEERMPNEQFDPVWYKNYYADVKLDGAFSLIHYILYGLEENRFMNANEKNEYERLKDSAEFNLQFYKNNYVDLASQDENFDCLLHYIRYGRNEGRNAVSQNLEEDIPQPPIEQDEIKVKLLAPVEKIDLDLNEQESIEYEMISSFNLDWSNYAEVNKHYTVHNNPIIDYIKNWNKYFSIVPNIFDTEFYLEIYPDIEESKMNPLLHYLTIGKEEGRQALFNEENILKGKLEYQDDKETIVFVSHESSASGAPLLGYNIADNLTNKYNIVHIIIRKSNIHESFLENCYEMFYGIELDTANNALIYMKRLQKNKIIKCVICNSVVTYPVLHAAYSLKIPTLMLIHEFTDYVKPAATVMNTIFLADQVIVPATIIQDSIQEELIQYSNNKTVPSNIHIIPQGKLPYIPESYGDSDSVDELCKKLKISSPDDTKIIVGSGWVQIRKGVDLFIATAKYIKNNYGDKCKFVWVGDGFNPEEDLAYSVWLQREIKFSGLEDDFIFLEHQKNLDTIFSISDVFCLTSRMDPFPNVVIDALGHDLHIACFDNASGSSEFLQKHNASCTIVDYVDTYQLAEGIIDYFNSAKTQEGYNRSLVDSYLNFDTYVKNIDKLVSESIAFKEKSQKITDELLQSGVFDADYFGGEGSVAKRCQSYVESSLKGIRLQNPKPGFSQLQWLHDNSKSNPYVVPLYEALKQGDITTHATYEVPHKVTDTIDFFYAVHLHLFYVDLADEFAQYFKNLPGKFDILITIVNEEDREKAMLAFSICGANDIKIILVENIGRDSGPLFFGLKDIVLTNDYEVIGHFHSKKSFDVVDGIGNRWRKFLTETLMGNEEVSKSVLNLFNSPNVGLVFPDDAHIVDIGENKEYIDGLCEMLNLPKVDETAIFPLGNMFWARVNAIKDLFELDPKEVLEEEPLPYDGSYMHAIERITPHLAVENGYRFLTVYSKGIKW